MAQLRALLLVVASAAVARHASGGDGAERERALAELETRLLADVLADDVGSIAAGVVVGSDVIWAAGFGLCDRERELEADENTLYRIASITKPITAVTMMILVQRGTLGLDDPVLKHLPEFAGLGGGRPEASTITLRQLASHTAGLAREPELEGAAEGPITGWEAKVLASIPRTALEGKPGAAFAYSNIGYGILGLALSRAAQKPFMELVRELVFEPAGMSSATFVVAPPLDARLAQGYEKDADGQIDGTRAAREHAGRGYKVPNGGVYTSARDLCRFIALVCGALGDGVLSAASRAELLRCQTPPGGVECGLGFFLSTDARGNRFAAHAGGVAGYTAQMVLHPASRTGVVLLRNYGEGRTDLQQAAETFLAALVAAGNG